MHATVSWCFPDPDREVLPNDVFQNSVDSDFFVVLPEDNRRFSRLFQALLTGVPVIFEDGFQDEFFGAKGEGVPFGTDSRLKDLPLVPDRTGKKQRSFQTILAHEKVIQCFDLLLHSSLEAGDGLGQRISLEFGVWSGNTEGDNQNAGQNDKTCGQKKNPDGF